jgi:hypothetical protein
MKLDVSHRDRLLLSGVFLAGALVIIAVGHGKELLGVGPHKYGLGFELASAVLGVWLGILTIWWARLRGKFDLFEPPVWISFNVYGQVVLNVWLLQRDRLPTIPWVVDNLESIMSLAVLLIGVGLTALWAGYAWTFREIARKGDNQQFPAGAMRLTNVKIIWLAGWIIGNVAVLTGIIGYLGTGVGESRKWLNYFHFINIVTNAATIALVVRQFRQPSMLGWIWVVVVVVSEIVARLVTGSKGFALTVLWLIMAVYYATGKLRARWFALLIFLVVVFVPVVNSYRTILHLVDPGQGVALSARLEALETAISDSINQSAGSSLDSATETFQQRQGAMLDITASVLTLHPDRIPFVGEEMIKNFFPQLIPRVLWPSKSTERPQLLMITSTYLDAPTEYSFSEIGLIADSYRAGGWVFVVVFFLIIGAGFSWLYLQGPGSGNLAGTIFYVIILTQLIRYENDIATTLISLVQFAPLIWGIVWLLMFHPHRWKRTPA